MKPCSRQKSLAHFQVISQQLKLQSQAVGKALEGGQEGLAQLLNQRGQQQREKDIFELPPVPNSDNADDFSSDSDEDVMRLLDIKDTTDIHQVDIESEAFKGLPAHRYRITRN